ncbi:hypothetical protein NM688_g7393 [Phlebia brevispora]|uniref:Uncharacterized protein n=1 Tax=Phlebia brevispora TaxID=194682 RepID=A0ACC1S5S8_9APHY|nr:hypothetical protein NM688_g7393 [Phlebia brevispora]
MGRYIITAAVVPSSSDPYTLARLLHADGAQLISNGEARASLDQLWTRDDRSLREHELVFVQSIQVSEQPNHRVYTEVRVGSRMAGSCGGRTAGLANYRLHNDPRYSGMDNGEGTPPLSEVIPVRPCSPDRVIMLTPHENHLPHSFAKTFCRRAFERMKAQRKCSSMDGAWSVTIPGHDTDAKMTKPRKSVRLYRVSHRTSFAHDLGPSGGVRKRRRQDVQKAVKAKRRTAVNSVFVRGSSIVLIEWVKNSPPCYGMARENEDAVSVNEDSNATVLLSRKTLMGRVLVAHLPRPTERGIDSGTEESLLIVCDRGPPARRAGYRRTYAEHADQLQHVSPGNHEVNLNYAGYWG